MTETRALMVIDVQKGLFEEPDPWKIYREDELLERINHVIDRARAADVPVIFVQHCGGEGDSLHPDSSGWALHPALHPLAGDLMIQKTEPDSFHETPLQAELKARGIQHLIMTGLQSDMCVDATSRRAAALGYVVTVVQDAHSTFEGQEMTAAEIIEERNRAFVKDGIARLVHAADEIF